ncbi:MAG: Zinc-transporting ATPase [Chlamydiae bacterium]|nr:Zinc-transporting ATPase [Chlamydiota bacterium]
MSLEKNISFNEFFSSGTDATISPFLTSESRKWAKDLPLRVSIFSAFLLLAAFVTSFFSSLGSLSLLLQVFIYFLVGTPALIAAIKEIFEWKINIDVLMVFAAFMSIFIHSSLEGCLLLVLFSISSAMESFVTTKAKSTLNHLSEVAPSSANVVAANGKLKQRSIKDVKVGETIFIRAGEVIPLDGIIVEGSSMLNVSHLTGEHVPIPIKEGGEAAAGTVNLDGTLKLKVSKTGAHSTISRIIQLICDAHEARPKLQTWFDRFGQRYSIFVILSSVVFALVFPLVFKHMTYFSVEGSIYRALAYLIAASPCALIIAVPIAYISSINASAKQGVILKGGITLDTLSKIQAIAFDKTGTLTSGDLECLSVTTVKGEPIEKDLPRILSVAMALEQHAIHPIAKAIVDYAEYRKVEAASLNNCRALPGHGIEGEIAINSQMQQVAIGNIGFIISKLQGEQKKELEKFSNVQGHLVTAMLIHQEVFIFQFVDHLKPEASNVLKSLKNHLGLNLYIFSGDNDLSVERVAKNLTVDRYYGGLKPEDKLQLVEQYSQEEGLAMVGDGVNDTPALARSSIGIAMGHFGSHMANEVAEVVLIKDDLSLIEPLIIRARKTLSIVRQNVFLASLIIVGISIPALFGIIPLWLAVICHEGGTVLVGLNSLRLLKNK